MKNGKYKEYILEYFRSPKIAVLHSIAIDKTYSSLDFNDLDNTAAETNKSIPVQNSYQIFYQQADH